MSDSRPHEQEHERDSGYREDRQRRVLNTLILNGPKNDHGDAPYVIK
jgi:hypothetical protein